MPTYIEPAEQLQEQNTMVSKKAEVKGRLSRPQEDFPANRSSPFHLQHDSVDAVTTLPTKCSQAFDWQQRRN